MSNYHLHLLRKLNVIARKTLTVNLSFFKALRGLRFSVITEIKHPFSIMFTSYTTLTVQGAVLVMLEKHNKHYMNVALSMLGVLKAVQLELILMNVMVPNIKNLMFLNTSLDGDIQHQAIVT